MVSEEDVKLTVLKTGLHPDDGEESICIFPSLPLASLHYTQHSEPCNSTHANENIKSDINTDDMSSI